MCCKVCLLILDGFGLRNETEGNAVKNASTPNIDALVKKWGMTELNASGEAVGLPEGQLRSGTSRNRFGADHLSRLGSDFKRNFRRQLL